jgi:hypothetical protein
MCDGNLAMANKTVDMSEKDMNELYGWEMFKVFARQHPVEAYDLRPNDFCKFMRSEGYDINNEKIKEIIDSCR